MLCSTATMPVNRMVDETPVTATGLDPESAWWLRVLAETGPSREAALARLHELLVRVAREAEWRDLLGALYRAVDKMLTVRQRVVFVAIVLNEVPLDTLVIELASNRNAIYKTLFDARRKLRSALVANGYIGDDSSRSS